MASKKHQKLVSEGADHHHRFWPKKLYGKNNPVITLPYSLHHSYHGYFMAQCKKWYIRVCQEGPCKYAGICCYHKQEVDYGKKVNYVIPDTE